MAKDKGDHTPEWLATLGTLKKQELENNRKVIDRSQAFRDGLIRPPWLKKTVEGVTKKVEGVTKEVRSLAQAISKPTDTAISPKEIRRSGKRDRLRLALREAYPDGIVPDHVGTQELINHDLTRIYKEHGWGEPPERDSVNRALGRRPD